MATPSWLAQVAGQAANAGAITQFLGAHGSQWVYTGAAQDAQSTAGSGTVSLQSGYLAQTIATKIGQTTIGRVALQIATVGGSGTSATIGPLSVSLYASLSNAPTGNLLASVQVPEPYVFNGSPWVSIPLYATGLSPAAPYALVLTGPGTSGAHYTWAKSNQTSGAATSPDDLTWTAQAYGLMYEVFDTTAAWPPIAICEDAGARITTLAYTANQPTGIAEYVQAQDGSCLVTSRTLSYTSGALTGVA